MVFDAKNPEFSSGGVDLLDPPAPVPVSISRRRHAKPSLDTSRATNAELVARAQAGDRLAWNELVERYTGLVEAVGVRYRLDRHDIHDVSQITWLRLTQHLGRLHDPERVGLWLYTTARRECLALIRRSGRTLPVDLDQDPVGTDGQPEELVGRAERAHHLRRALGRLPEACRTLLELMLIQDPPAPYTEISQRCDIAVGTIGPRRKRCLAHLRRLYHEVFPDAENEERS